MAAAEGAIIKIDERLDSLPDYLYADALKTCEAQLNALEETVTECVTQLQLMQTTQAEALARTAEAEAEEAQAEAIETIVEALEAEPEVVEPEATMEEVLELEPETESESEAVPEKSSSWWENLFALR